MKDIVILSAKRTPMGAFNGAFSGLSATDLGAIAIKGAFEQAGLDACAIDEVIMGCVLSAGLGQAPARQAMLKAGLNEKVGAITVNKVCGSGLVSVMQAANAIKAEQADVVIAGGMDSMTNAPYALTKARGGFRMGHGEIQDTMFTDGLEDAGTGTLMGVYAQQMADRLGHSRKRMDEFAVQSLSRANTAITQGYFKDEITPVIIKDKKGEQVIDVDEPPSRAKADKIPTLKPAFAKDGTITAANASSISDGAAAVALSSKSYADDHHLPVLATIKAYATHSKTPSEFTTAPIGAIKNVLDKAGWTAEEVDVWEINEAFAMVTLGAIDAFGLDPAKVNIHGGACALGHPLGCSGTRILVTLIHALKRTGGKKGVASLCIGGGEGVAMAIELA